jgi:hypothetical protein
MTGNPNGKKTSRADTHQPVHAMDEGVSVVPSRRRFLAGLGAGGIALGTAAAPAFAGGRGNGDGGERADRRRDGDRASSASGADRGSSRDEAVGQFVRIFDGPAFAEPSEALTEALVEVGRPGGIMDAADPLDIGPVRLITEPERSPRNRDNPTHTAGTTFVGQFLDHDLTNDAGSTLGVPTPLSNSMNLRSARFDLDSLYGGGPHVSPHLYQQGRANHGRFLIESGGRFEDLPRAVDNSALIADGRNDENLIISGLQAALLMFHNQVLDTAVSESLRGHRAFSRARRLVRWHYQWLILHEFLPKFVGQAMVDDVLTNGRRWFTETRGRVPIEFQGAAYRFGHSMIRPSYRANMAGDGGEPFFALVFDADQMGNRDPDDLTGRVRAQRRYVGWQTFFDFGDGEVKPNKRIDTLISTPMFNLPTSTIASPSGQPIGPLSLPTRNLLRHITWALPSGQWVADQMGAFAVAPADLADIGDIEPSLATSTPLWFYILREADVFADGLHLGAVGGRIVAETFIGLLQNDPTSYLTAEPSWAPTLPSAGDDFTMTDLLTIAGVDPTSRGE